MAKAQCGAQVQMGTYTYAARYSYRQCGNAAKENGFCTVHQRYAEITPDDREAFAQMRDALVPKTP